MQTRIQTFGQQYYWSRSNLSPVHTYHKYSWNVTFNILSRKVKFIRLQNFTAFFLQEATFQVYKLGKEKKKNRRRNKTFAFRSIDTSPSDLLENTNCKVPSTGNLPSRCARLVFFPSTTKEESSWHAIRGRRRGQSVSPSRRGRRREERSSTSADRSLGFYATGARVSGEGCMLGCIQAPNNILEYRRRSTEGAVVNRRGYECGWLNFPRLSR